MAVVVICFVFYIAVHNILCNEVLQKDKNKFFLEEKPQNHFGTYFYEKLNFFLLCNYILFLY